MRPRQGLVELFASFLQVETVSSQSWVMDTRLRRSMQARLNQVAQSNAAEPAEAFWASYWYRQWSDLVSASVSGSVSAPSAKETQLGKSDRTPTTPLTTLAIDHLSAYLQEPCYWAVYRIFRRFQSSQSVQSEFADCFQLAIASISVVLRRYQVDRGASLRTYSEMAFGSVLRDVLRQRHEVDLCSDWQLLRKTGKKPLTDALQAAGLSAEAIAQYRLAWTCFNQIYVPELRSHKLPSLNDAFWSAVAQLYQQERLSQLGTTGAAVTAQSIEQWLTRTAKWIRQYRYPAVASLNVAKSEQNAAELQDSLPDESGDSLLTELIEQEDEQARRTQRTEVDAVLQQAIANLDPESQKILQLYYQAQQTQQQITQQTGLNQSTISRRLKSAKKNLLKTLAEWTTETLHISLSPDLIESMSVAVEEWFHAYYAVPHEAVPHEAVPHEGFAE